MNLILPSSNTQILQAFENLGKIGEGTYGLVLKARVKETGELVAIKRFKETDRDDQVGIIIKNQHSS